MEKRNIQKYTWIALTTLLLASCKLPVLVNREVNTSVPEAYTNTTTDSTNSASVNWRTIFNDPSLIALIDTALSHNQELNILLQEIEISRNEIRARKGEYLPFVGVKAGAGVDKVPRYTNIGALEATTEIKPGKEMPEPLGDFGIGLYASWEVDIWHKLRNATKAANLRYLSTVEGRNFMVTNLVAEIAASYYELLALDKQLEILQQNIAIQKNALELVKVQKEATKVTELAVRRFDAQLANTRSMEFNIHQQITETENRINFLLGRFPQPVPRNNGDFEQSLLPALQTGLPTQLLFNRPDIRQSELELAAAKLDVSVARAQFYPSLGIRSALGLGAFNPGYLLKAPESMLFSLAGDLAAPLINRNALKASYLNANAKQLQTVYEYEQKLLSAFLETKNQVSNINNLENSYLQKKQQVEDLVMSVDISNRLFNAARADYTEVLFTQREALEARVELVETKLKQWQASINLYHALGGGWR
ncbi:efflux transporter outer membrane subunit [Flavihumibacter sp. CACIAM 22H1]|uniref:TolC family protein n=1 Tax=Flavihumibacter sp. CACIAM 22H1 TaxID=1812911 RepID=UPI0007A8E0F0|nr:efflux transporter outer membrane subunit [Flavihumibacter sp. CACIAM 22H1]KYP15332.1 MAG: RND transporter [Flavihumibacter sp. CACIAM 22H1]